MSTGLDTQRKAALMPDRRLHRDGTTGFPIGTRPPAPTFWTLRKLNEALASGVFTSTDLVRLSLERIERSQPQLAAFATVEAESALNAAAEADTRRAQGRPLGPLDGVPVAVKDMFDTAGRLGACGSLSWKSRHAERNSVVVERLQQAGACIVGKTNMVEFAFGAWGTNPHLGTPWNPWDLTVHRIPGGSSSGSAVAVAAGLVPIAIGSDTGGSVRTPSALNGVTGLKSTRGTVSLVGALPLSASLDSVGVLARTAEDAWTGLAGLAEHPAEPIEERTLAGTTIAVLDERAFGGSVDPEIVAAYHNAKSLFEAAGARLETRVWPFDVAEIIAATGVVIAVEGWQQHGAMVSDPNSLIGPAVRTRLLAGRDLDTATYQAALAKHHALTRMWPAWLGDATALLTPSLPIVACPITEVDESSTALGLFTRVGNYVGACGLSLPAGFSTNGLPIGVQLLARAHQENCLASIGKAFQKNSTFHLCRPELAALGL